VLDVVLTDPWVSLSGGGESHHWLLGLDATCYCNTSPVWLVLLGLDVTVLL